MNKGRYFVSICLALLNVTWAILQNIIAFFIFVFVAPSSVIGRYRGMITVYYKFKTTFCLGAFAFISTKGEGAEKERAHTYGHFIQSLILGPLYIFVIIIPLLVMRSKKATLRRAERLIPYDSIWQERSAIHHARFFGERI